MWVVRGELTAGSGSPFVDLYFDSYLLAVRYVVFCELLSNVIWFNARLADTEDDEDGREYARRVSEYYAVRDDVQSADSNVGAANAYERFTRLSLAMSTDFDEIGFEYRISEVSKRCTPPEWGVLNAPDAPLLAVPSKRSRRAREKSPRKAGQTQAQKGEDGRSVV